MTTLSAPSPLIPRARATTKDGAPVVGVPVVDAPVVDAPVVGAAVAGTAVIGAPGVSAPGVGAAERQREGTQPAPSSPRREWAGVKWALVVFCVVSAVVGRVSYLNKPFDHDGRMFVYLGKLVADGDRFGHDLTDNKFPSVGLMTSAAWRAFGASWWPYVLLQTAMGLAWALLLARAVARHAGEHARLPTLLFALVYLNFNVAVFGGFQLETIQVFFSILAAGAAMEALSARSRPRASNPTGAPTAPDRARSGATSCAEFGATFGGATSRAAFGATFGAASGANSGATPVAERSEVPDSSTGRSVLVGSADDAENAKNAENAEGSVGCGDVATPPAIVLPRALRGAAADAGAEAMFDVEASPAAVRDAGWDAGRVGDLRDAFVVGLAGGCAMMLKPTGGAVLSAFAVAACAAWLARRPGRLVWHGLVAAAGLAIPLGAVLAYLVGTDTLRDVPGLYGQIARYAAETPLDLSDWLKPIVVCTLVGFPLLVRGWVLRREKSGTPVRWTLVIFAAAWFAIELAGAVMQRRMYAYHFLPVAAPAAVLFGLLPRRDRAIPLAAAVLPLGALSLVASSQLLDACAAEPPVQRLAASDYLAARTGPREFVWADSIGRLLIETDLRAGSRIGLTFLFFNHDAAPLEYSETMLADFERRRPRYVLLPEDLEKRLRYDVARSPEMARRPVRAANYRAAWERIAGYVAERYVRETRIGDEAVWRRK